MKIKIEFTSENKLTVIGIDCITIANEDGTISIEPLDKKQKEDLLLRKILEENPSYYDPNGNVSIILDKNGRRLTEFGSEFPIRFLDPSQVRIYDEKGNEILCSCGKLASSSIIGKNHSQYFCSKCFDVLSRNKENQYVR